MHAWQHARECTVFLSTVVHTRSESIRFLQAREAKQAGHPVFLNCYTHPIAKTKAAAVSVPKRVGASRKTPRIARIAHAWPHDTGCGAAADLSEALPIHSEEVPAEFLTAVSGHGDHTRRLLAGIEMVSPGARIFPRRAWRLGITGTFDRPGRAAYLLAYHAHQRTAGAGIQLLRHAARPISQPAGFHGQFHGVRHLNRHRRRRRWRCS